MRRNFEENLQELREFCERENRLPYFSYKGKGNNRLVCFMKKYKDDPRIIGIKEKYAKIKSFEESLQELIDFCKRENRLPSKENNRLKGFLARHRADPRIIEIKNNYCNGFGGRKPRFFDENLKDLIEFCEREGRLPSQRYDRKEIKLVGFLRYYKNDSRIIEIKRKYLRRGNSFEENLQELAEFCERENKLPSGCENPRLNRFIYSYRDDPRVIDIKKKYSSGGA